MKSGNWFTLTSILFLTACGSSAPGSNNLSSKPSDSVNEVERPVGTALSPAQTTALLDGSGFFTYSRGMYLSASSNTHLTHNAITCDYVTKIYTVYLKTEGAYGYVYRKTITGGSFDGTTCSHHSVTAVEVDKAKLPLNYSDFSTTSPDDTSTTQVYSSNHKLQIYTSASSDGANYSSLTSYESPRVESVFIGVVARQLILNSTDTSSGTADTTSEKTISKRLGFGLNYNVDTFKTEFKNVKLCMSETPSSTPVCEVKDITNLIY
jgi:hypothetical protein